MGHGEDQSGARQDRTRGLGRTRVVPGRTGPEGMERAEGAGEQESAGGGCTPEGARGTGQGSGTEWPSLTQQQQQVQILVRQ